MVRITQVASLPAYSNLVREAQHRVGAAGRRISAAPSLYLTSNRDDVDVESRKGTHHQRLDLSSSNAKVGKNCSAQPIQEIGVRTGKMIRQHCPKIASSEANRHPYVSLGMAGPSWLAFAGRIAVRGMHPGRTDASSTTSGQCRDPA